jgi:low temperature requirement protein LtrA
VNHQHALLTVACLLRTTGLFLFKHRVGTSNSTSSFMTNASSLTVASLLGSTTLLLPPPKIALEQATPHSLLSSSTHTP